MKKAILVFSSILLITSCSNNVQTGNLVINNPIDSVHFITSNYLEINKVSQISKFRSGIGHDYSDDFESCRSMKHYFEFKDTVDWSKVKIFSPVNGTVVRLDTEWAGIQIHIKPQISPNFNVIIFHLNFTIPIKIGDTLKSGQMIGFHIGNQTDSDIAIANYTNNKYNLQSYFDFITDSLFNTFIQKGAISKTDFIISKELRDTNPLTCQQDAFQTEGIIENWFKFKK